MLAVRAAAVTHASSKYEIARRLRVHRDTLTKFIELNGIAPVASAPVA